MFIYINRYRCVSMYINKYKCTNSYKYIKLSDFNLQSIVLKPELSTLCILAQVLTVD